MLLHLWVCFFFPSLSAGLDAAELASLNPSAFSFIRKSCIPLIPSSNFVVSTETCCNTHTRTCVSQFILSLQSLSPAQLESLGPDNAELVTSMQRAALGDEQLAALERASTGSYDQPKSSDTSGKGDASLRCLTGKKRFCIQSVSFWPRSSIDEHRGRLGLHEAFPVSPDGLPAAVRRRRLPACRSGYCTITACGYMYV